MINSIQNQNHLLEIKKEVDESADSMLKKIVQISMYSNPIESIIREIVSNAVDAVQEKNIFKEIKQNPESISKYYESSNNKEYKDSKFDANYTDVENLSDCDDVFIKIVERDDKYYLQIIDYGIGVSFNRLIGMTNIGYSTKRLMKDLKGFFGLGSKCALSYAKEEYYTLYCTHDKKQFVFNCFESDIKSSVEMFEDGIKNDFIEYNSNRIYYRKTEEKNNTMFEVKIEYYDINKFINAVKKQLLYFTGIRLFYNKQEIPLTQEVIYEDENIVINKQNNIYASPHLLVVSDFKEKNKNPICYGKIDFSLLEIENHYGNIGLKIQIRSLISDGNDFKLINDGVEVTPSRESIIYKRSTINYLIRRITETKEKLLSKVTNLFPSFNENDSLFKRILSLSRFHSEEINEIKKFISYQEVKIRLKDDIYFLSGKAVKFKEKNETENQLAAYYYDNKKQFYVSLLNLPENVYIRDTFHYSNFVENYQSFYKEKLVFLETTNNDFLTDCPANIIPLSKLMNDLKDEKILFLDENSFKKEIRKPDYTLFNFEDVSGYKLNPSKGKKNEKLDYYVYHKEDCELNSIQQFQQKYNLKIARVESKNKFKYFNNILEDYIVKNYYEGIRSYHIIQEASKLVESKYSDIIKYNDLNTIYSFLFDTIFSRIKFLDEFKGNFIINKSFLKNILSKYYYSLDYTVIKLRDFKGVLDKIKNDPFTVKGIEEMTNLISFIIENNNGIIDLIVISKDKEKFEKNNYIKHLLREELNKLFENYESK